MPATSRPREAELVHDRHEDHDERRRRTGDLKPRAAEQRADHAGDDRGVEPVLRRTRRRDRERHRQRQRDDADHERREQVGAEVLAACSPRAAVGAARTRSDPSSVYAIASWLLEALQTAPPHSGATAESHRRSITQLHVPPRRADHRDARPRHVRPHASGRRDRARKFCAAWPRDGVHPPHERLADHLRERRSGGASRPRTFAARLVPDGDPLFAHDEEGPDDMPAHVRSVLTQTSIVIPIANGAARARDLAGALSVGAPHRGAPAQGHGDGDR